MKKTVDLHPDPIKIFKRAGEAEKFKVPKSFYLRDLRLTLKSQVTFFFAQSMKLVRHLSLSFFFWFWNLKKRFFFCSLILFCIVHKLKNQ